MEGFDSIIPKEWKYPLQRMSSIVWEEKIKRLEQKIKEWTKTKFPIPSNERKQGDEKIEVIHYQIEEEGN